MVETFLEERKDFFYINILVCDEFNKKRFW